MATPTKAGIAAQDFLSLFVSPEKRYQYKNEWRPEMVEQNEAALAGMTVEEYRADQDKKAKAKAKAAKDKIAKEAAKKRDADARAAAAAAAAADDETDDEADDEALASPRIPLSNVGTGRFTPQKKAAVSDENAEQWYIAGALVLLVGGAVYYSYSRRK
jgi:hypothetical protein